MTKPFNRRFAPAVTLGSSIALWAMATAVLGAGAVSCSSTPSPPTGTGGQGTGGSGGTAGANTGGTSAGGTTGGTAGANTGGTSAGGTTGGTAGANTGGTSAGGTTGGSAGASGGTTGGAGSGAGGSATGGGGSGAGGTAGGGAGGAGGSGAGSGGAAGSGAGSGGNGGDAGWRDLFNGMNLTGWTPSQGHAALYAVGMQDGGPVIHVYPTQADQSNQPEATLRTTESFSNYVFRLEYKWGTKRFGARSQTDRDNGICFHICGNAGQVWPESIELQIGSQAWPGDWVTGNIFMLINKTRAQWSYTTMNGQQVYSENGTMRSIGAPMSYFKGLVPSPNLNMNTGWNTVELTVRGAEEAEYKVNGTVVNRLFDMECDEGGGFQPLTEGAIALQAEYAEIYFRNIRIREME